MYTAYPSNNRQVRMNYYGCSIPYYEPKDSVMEIKMSVSPETGVMYGLFDDKKEYPIECMLIMSEDFSGEMQESALFGYSDVAKRSIKPMSKSSHFSG